MGTLAKIVCLGFGAFYVVGLLLFFMAPTIYKRFRPRLGSQADDKVANASKR